MTALDETTGNFEQERDDSLVLSRLTCSFGAI